MDEVNPERLDSERKSEDEPHLVHVAKTDPSALIEKSKKLNKEINELVTKSKRLTQEAQALFKQVELHLPEALLKSCQISMPAKPSALPKFSKGGSAVPAKGTGKSLTNIPKGLEWMKSKKDFKGSLLTDCTTSEPNNQGTGLSSVRETFTKQDDLSLDKIIADFDKLNEFTSGQQNATNQRTAKAQIMSHADYNNNGLSNPEHQSPVTELEDFETIEAQIKQQFSISSEPDGPTNNGSHTFQGCTSSPPRREAETKFTPINHQPDDFEVKYKNLQELINSTKTDIESITKPQPKRKQKQRVG